MGKKKVRQIAFIVAIVFITIAMLFTAATVLEIRPINVTLSDIPITSSKTKQDFDLETGVAAVGTLSGGVKYITGDNKIYPIASIAKVITVLTVLDEKNLNKDDNNLIIVMSSNDVALWETTVVENGTNLEITDGQQLTLRQILDGILLSSANNLADSLAIWAFGSIDNYRVSAEKWLANNGLGDTKIGADASGLDPGTTSTADNLIKLGQLAMQNNLVREIVAQETVAFPKIGEIWNLNQLVGQSGYIGIKTGTTEEAGNSLLFANDRYGEIIIGAILGQETNAERFIETERLMNFAGSQIEVLSLASGTTVGRYELPWGETAKIVTVSDIKTIVWAGETLEPIMNVNLFEAELQKDAVVGTITLGSETTDLIVTGNTQMPDIFWRVTNLDKLKF